MKTLIALCLTGLLVPSLVSGNQKEAAPLQPVTVFALRHAETLESTQTARDPELSHDGKVRAATLARLLARAGVTHLFSSPYARTQTTLAPLAEALKLEVTVIDPKKTDSYVAALTALPPGSVAVVAGHSNTVPGLVKALGGEATDLESHPSYGPMLAHDSHNRLFQITLPGVDGAAVSTIELRYGE